MDVWTFNFNVSMSGIWGRSVPAVYGPSSFKNGSGDINKCELKDISAHTFRNCINKSSFDETGTRAVGSMRTSQCQVIVFVLFKTRNDYKADAVAEQCNFLIKQSLRDKHKQRKP